MSDRTTHSATRFRDPDGALVGSQLKPLRTRDDELLDVLGDIRDELKLQTSALQMILEELSGDFITRTNLEEATKEGE